jgi:hypothetical protein
MNEDIRPVSALRKIAEQYPDLGKRLNRYMAEKGNKFPDLHGGVFLSGDGWAEIAKTYGVVGDTYERYTEIERLSTVGTWRFAQGIYRFDDEIYRALVETELPNTVPLDVFLRLPEWCIYIETPGMTAGGEITHGVYAFLDYEHNYGENSAHVLKLTFDRAPSFSYCDIPLTGGASISGIFENFWNKHAPDYFKQDVFLKQAFTDATIKAVKPILSMLLYICSDEPEIDNAREFGLYPSKTYPKNVKGGFKLFAPERVRIWDVGKQTGQLLTKAKASNRRLSNAEHRKSPEPHLRRAHWHGYRTGKGRKTFGFKWLPPIAVNVRDDDFDGR